MEKAKQTIFEVRHFIKRRLKERRMTYADLAKTLKVSEVTVKRWMSNQEPRLSDLEAIGKVLGFSTRSPIAFTELSSSVEQLYTLAQEEYFVSKPLAAFLFLKLFIGETFENAISKSRISKKQAFSYLREMEELDIVEVFPSDKVVVKLKGPFKWIPNGPMMNHYLNTFREIINKNIKDRNPIYDDAKNEYGFYRAFETYMQESTAKKFSQELRDLFLHYRTIANMEYRNRLNVVPVAGILCMDSFDAWSEVFLISQESEPASSAL